MRLAGRPGSFPYSYCDIQGVEIIHNFHDSHGSDSDMTRNGIVVNITIPNTLIQQHNHVDFHLEKPPMPISRPKFFSISFRYFPETIQLQRVYQLYIGTRLMEFW